MNSQQPPSYDDVIGENKSQNPCPQFPHQIVIIEQREYNRPKKRDPFNHFLCCVSALCTGCFTLPCWCCYCFTENDSN